MTHAKGKLHANLNPAKTPGDKRPAFQGKLTLPGNSATRDLVLWTSRDRNGASLLTGRAGLSAVEQIDQLSAPPVAPDGGVDAPLTNGSQFAIDPYQVMLFTARDRTPNGPAYHGLYHPGVDAPLMHLAVWAKTDRNGAARLSGIVELHRAAPERDHSRAKTRRRERER